MSFPSRGREERASHEASRPDPADLASRLDEHRAWCTSGGSAGTRADLSGLVLDELDLSGRTLRGADLRRASLRDARVEGADLSGADLRGADLTRAHLRGSRLEEALLYRATLRHADLSRTKGLLVEQLRGADLAGARVPAGLLSREASEDLAETMKSCRAILFAMLLACAYILLAVFDTRDVDFLTNTRALALPLVGASVPVVGFFVAGPLLLLALFGYLHQKLGSILGKLARLPAVFPDGRRLYEGVYPWILASIVHEGYRALYRLPHRRLRLGVLSSGLIGWGLAPLTLVIVWGQYLAKHDPWVTTFHVVSVVLVVTFAMASFQHGRHLIRRPEGAEEERPRDAVLHGSMTGFAMGVVLGSVSVLAMNGLGGLPHLPPVLNPYATLVGEDLTSATGDGNGDTRVDLSGANLIRADATAINATGVRLRGADLSLARCSRGNLDLAVLDGAQATTVILTHGSLIGASAREADLSGAELRGACLQGARLGGANLTGADLRGADLTGADLEKADLTDAKLEGARLDCANLFDAVLVRADLDKASLLNATLTAARLTHAQLQESWLVGVRARHAEFIDVHMVGAVLSRGDFANADFTDAEMGRVWLDGANLRGAILAGTVLNDAHLAHADLDGGRLAGAWLESADLRRARLLGADLTGTRLDMANLYEAELVQATLEDAVLYGANLDGASLAFATLRGADLEDAHLARSTGWEDADTEGLNLDMVSCATGEPGTDHEAMNRDWTRPGAIEVPASTRCRERLERLVTADRSPGEWVRRAHSCLKGPPPARPDGRAVDAGVLPASGW